MNGRFPIGSKDPIAFKTLRPLDQRANNVFCRLRYRKFVNARLPARAFRIAQYKESTRKVHVSASEAQQLGSTLPAEQQSQFECRSNGLRLDDGQSLPIDRKLGLR